MIFPPVVAAGQVTAAADDQRRMFPVSRAHAAPRAALMFTSGPAHGVAMGTFEGEPLYHASLDGIEYRALLKENGFTVLAHAVENPGCGGHTVWLAQLGQVGKPLHPAPLRAFSPSCASCWR